jgi:hypothetical protein
VIDQALRPHGASEQGAGSSLVRRLRALSWSDRERPAGWTQALVLLPVIVGIYFALLLDDGTVSWWIREDHPVESLGALSLLASSIACIVLWRRVHRRGDWPFIRRLSLLGLAALFFFGFGEEISWGQRIFGYGTPEAVGQANTQDETTVHNLAVFSGEFDMDHLFQLFWLVMGVVIPVLALWARPRRFLRRFVPILPVGLAGLFVLNQVLTRSFHAAFSRDAGLWNSTTFGFNHGIFETKETVASLLLATGFWLLVWRDRAAHPRDAREPDLPPTAEAPTREPAAREPAAG